MEPLTRNASSSLSPGSRTQRPALLRIGSVSYLNAKPLIHGLENQADLELRLDVPANLLGGLQSGAFDVALLPVIDYQRLPGLKIVPAGGIGCDGSTLTVRIFSAKPIEKMTALACDIESHTSVALARIILAERYGLKPEMVELTRQREPAAGDASEARLLIGDKVVCEEPPGLEYQLDLGQAWKALTGMPFVFAAWVARAGIDLGDLPARLERAKKEGLADLPRIVERYAIGRGWPRGLALQYLRDYLKYDIGQAQLDAIKHFHDLAYQYGIIGPPRELEMY